MKRFISGLAVGLFLVGIAWSYSAYFHVSISLIEGIVGGSLLAVFCGIIATIGGFDKLMDNLPNL